MVAANSPELSQWPIGHIECISNLIVKLICEQTVVLMTKLNYIPLFELVSEPLMIA